MAKSPPGRWRRATHKGGWGIWTLVIDGASVASAYQIAAPGVYGWHLTGTVSIQGDAKSLYAAQRKVRKALREREGDANAQQTE